MTCDEFRRITNTDPDDCTNAECVAAFAHYYECEACRVETDLEESRAGCGLTPDDDAAMARRAAVCMLDPECQRDLDSALRKIKGGG